MTPTSAARSIMLSATIVSLFFSTGVAQQDTMPQSIFFVSVVKSIAGQKPSLEFFDVNTRFSFTPTLFSMAGADIALSNVQTDTVGSKQDKFTEAGIMLNYVLPISKDTCRHLFGGIHFKIFNTIPYFGFVLGSVEVRGKLLSSYFTLSILRTVNEVDTVFAHSLGKNMFQDNAYIEFALYSSKVSFLQYLRVKGGVLVPAWWNKGPRPTNQDIVTRITVEVPVGTIEPL